jgi:hypothetical protein
VPPAVAPLNYISSGILRRIFSPNWDFRGVFSISNNAVRISAAAMGGAGDIILIKKKESNKKVRTYTGAHTVIFRGGLSLSGTVERYMPLAARVRA